MAQQVYILTAEEYSMVQGMAKRIEQLENENKTLREFNLKKSQALDQAKLSIKERDERLADLVKSRQLDQKALANQAHELLVKEAELANLSSKLREAKRDCEGTSACLAETEKISASRLKSMNNLIREVRRLKSEHVCIATNPQNGHVKVISVAKTDTYRKFGWMVSEEYLVDRPA